MGLLVYKVADYSFTAEREQYRAICEMLKKHYSSRSEVCLFVANYSIYDSEIDGILFKNDAVISVEFKNYGGEVTAVENGCWTLADGTIVKGGSRKNPYQQAKVNHVNLKQGLSAESLPFDVPASAVPESVPREQTPPPSDNVHYLDKSKIRVSSDRIEMLADNEVFVFGSNIGGKHVGGAARQAYQKFGAEWGVGSGPTGKCYAIPTMHGGIEVVASYVDAFIKYASEHPELRFLVTKVGCGVAKFHPNQIAPLFAQAVDLPNVYLPAEFWLYLPK